MNKKKVFVIILIITIILISVLAILYFTTDLFKSNEELFWKYFAQSKDVIKIIENDKFSNQAEYKKSNSYESAGNITFIKEQGEESSKQFNVVTTARHDKNTGRTYADATLKNGELDLFKASYINSRRYLCYKM